MTLGMRTTCSNRMASGALNRHSNYFTAFSNRGNSFHAHIYTFGSLIQKTTRYTGRYQDSIKRTAMSESGPRSSRQLLTTTNAKTPRFYDLDSEFVPVEFWQGVGRTGALNTSAASYLQRIWRGLDLMTREYILWSVGILVRKNASAGKTSKP